MLLYYTVVIEVAFTESLFSGNETSGFVGVTIMATKVSQNPYEVVVAPAQSEPPSALGICLQESIILCWFAVYFYISYTDLHKQQETV